MINFKEKYNRRNFIKFLGNFLPDDFEEKEKTLNFEKKFEKIKEIEEIGEVPSLGTNKPLKIYEVKHISESDPRVTLTKEAFWILSNEGVRRALMIFYSENSESYRFSLMTIDLKGDGKKVKREFSNPRRFSFFLGPDAKTKTPEKFLSSKVENFKDLQSCFSVEVVTKEFFKNYKNLFEKLVEHLEKDSAFKVFSEKHGIKIENFAKKILGQIVFLYFLQKRGWLGAKKGESISDGDKDFLRRLFEKCSENKENFFNDYLEHLFYDALNKQPEGAGSFYRKRFDCQIPFLNGGLFEPINDYNWKEEFLYIPNEIFSNDKNTGILDIFDIYNFTIDESMPSDQEVSVDPEMLGKVFENLLEDNIRKGQGAYYTPREIVHYMCQESLINYLESKTKTKTNRIRKLIKGDLMRELVRGKGYFEEEFEEVNKLLKEVKVVDPACGSGAFLVGMLQEIIKARSFCLSLIGEDVDNYKLKKGTIQKCLYGVDIDPGAIDIAKLRLWLSIVVEEDINEIEPLPNLEYKIMQGNSLLENLVVGDSVIEFEFDGSKKIDKRTKEYKEILKNRGGKQTKIFYEKSETLTEEMEKLHTEYFNISDLEKKKILKKKIDSKEYELIQSKCQEEIKNLENYIQNHPTKSKKITRATEQIMSIKKVLNKWKKDRIRPFFPWKLHFGEVFRERGGFDVVIGNPPYIKEYTDKSIFEALRGSEYYQGKMDFWYFFSCYGLDILRGGGIQAFIAPNNWISNFGAKIMRKKILDETKILQFIDFGNYKVFDTAGIQTMVYLLKKDKDNNNYNLKYGKLKNPNPDFNLLGKFVNAGFDKSNDDFEKFVFDFHKENFKDRNIQFLNPKISKIVNLIEKKGEFYLNNKEVANGIHSHFDFIGKKHLLKLNNNYKAGDGIFALSNKEKENLNLQDCEEGLIKPYFLTSEFFKYGTNPVNNNWIIYTTSKFRNEKEIEKYPNIKKHLDEFRNVITSDNKPYGLHRARDEKFFKGEKIVVARKCSNPEFSYNDFDCYVSAAFYIIKTGRIDMKYLLGILNSQLIKFWLKYKGKMQGNNYQIDKEPIINIPIAIGGESIKQPIIEKVNQIIELKKENPETNTSKLENQIDQMVYELYGLNEEEIKTIENSR